MDEQPIKIRVGDLSPEQMIKKMFQEMRQRGYVEDFGDWEAFMASDDEGYSVVFFTFECGALVAIIGADQEYFQKMKFIFDGSGYQILHFDVVDKTPQDVLNFFIKALTKIKHGRQDVDQMEFIIKIVTLVEESSREKVYALQADNFLRVILHNADIDFVTSLHSLLGS